MSNSKLPNQFYFGALCPPPSKQVVFKHKNNANLVDRLAESINLCSIQGILTDTEVDKARRRLVKFIVEKIKEEGKEC